MKNRLMLIPLVLAVSLLMGACAEGTFPTDLPADLEGLDSLEVEVSGDGASLSVDEIEITGVVSMISDNAWTIAGQSFMITSKTEIKGALELGDTAKVHAYLGEGGEVFAREIEPAEEDDDSDDDDSVDEKLSELEEDGHEIEFVGVVESMGNPTWLVGGREILVTSDTEINGTITDGMLVKVHASFVEGEGLVAREVEPANEDDLDEDEFDDDDDLKIEGVVESIGEDYVVVDGTKFYFADFTEFEDEISSGDLVEIYFLEQDDGTYVVREIELEDLEDDEINNDLDDEDDDDDDEYDDDDDDDDDHEEDDDHDDDDHEEDDHDKEDDD